MKNSTNPHPLVSVIVLNWNRPHDTLACIESLKKQSYKDIEIIIVDNGSIDDSKKILKKVQGITLVENPTNRGFTGGHIDGLQYAKGDFIFVLNNDAVVDKSYVKNALEIFAKDNTIGVVGGRSYQWQDEDQIHNDNGPFYAFQTINRFTMEGIFARSDAGYDHETNWVSGSAMVIRKEAIEKAGYLFDPMFAYYEESDLFARIQAANYTIVYSPSLKIWHKDGASSSSFFQFNQLFKNRFVYGMRNLESKDLARFIKSYAKLTLRGSYHHFTQRSKDENEKIMNHALSSALGSSITSWPKWVISRKDVAKRDTQGFNLSDRLKIEQTGISFICDLSEDIEQVSKLINFIKTISFKHYNSEIILVCSKDKEPNLVTLLSALNVDNPNVRIASNTGQSKVDPLNFGWLAAAKEFIWFIDTSYQPTINIVRRTILQTKETSEFNLCIESLDGKLNSVSKNTLVSRNLLALHGGIKSKGLSELYVKLVELAYNLSDANLYISRRTTIDHPIEYQLTSEDRKGIKQTLHAHRDQKQKNTRYTKILERYYRLYQLHNLSTWLFINDVSARHKLARIRNSLVATLRLNRKELALELKHISNEVVKSKHSGFDKDHRNLEIIAKITNAIKSDEWKKTPIFIICRDRVTPLKELISWLESIEMKNIFLVDNDSIYPELLNFYKDTQYQVIKTKKNVGHTVVWKEGIAKTLFPEQFYIVTDPDVIPDDACPDDAVKHFYELHKKYIDYQKVGFGLQIDDLPDHYKLKSHVVEWENQFWNNQLEDGVFEAGVDTTFALYKPYTDYYTLHPSIRTGRPYTAKHLPWYVDSTQIDEEEAFYRMHASQDITSWNSDEILERYKKELKNK